MSEQGIFVWDRSNLHFSLGLALKDTTLFLKIGQFYNSPRVKQLSFTIFYIITSYLAGEYFQVLQHIIAPSAPMVQQQSSLIITPEWEYTS